MTHTEHPNPDMETWLTAVTDSLLADADARVDHLLSQYDIPRYEAKGLLALIRDLKAALTEERPSRRYARRLKYELMGEPQLHVVTRWRLLPPRVHIAAGIVFIAGMVLLNRRRLLTTEQDDPQEITA